MTDLGTLGGTSSYAWSINDSGQMVGDGYTAQGNHAALSSNGTAPVPEPATMLLVGSGLFGLAGFRKKLTRKVWPKCFNNIWGGEL